MLDHISERSWLYAGDAGWSGSRHFFEKNASPLARGCRVYALDLRGHGESGRPPHVGSCPINFQIVQNTVVWFERQQVRVPGHGPMCACGAASSACMQSSMQRRWVHPQAPPNEDCHVTATSVTMIRMLPQGYHTARLAADLQDFLVALDLQVGFLHSCLT